MKCDLFSNVFMFHKRYQYQKLCHYISLYKWLTIIRNTNYFSNFLYLSRICSCLLICKLVTIKKISRKNQRLILIPTTVFSEKNFRFFIFNWFCKSHRKLNVMILLLSHSSIDFNGMLKPKASYCLS